jgi:hypothetical protein
VLQLITLVREAARDDGKISKAALASIIVSACTTGFTVATISFDFDVDPARRRDFGDFYGYIPDSAGKRTAIFLCMIVNGALLLLLRSLSTALLASVSGRLVLYYYLGEHALYLTYKTVRGDLQHWVPHAGAAASVFERVVVKTISDFTGVVQFRAPAEMGGAAWACSQFMALAASLLATHIYVSSSTTAARLDSAAIWTIVGGLSAGWLLFSVMFLALMKKEFRGTCACDIPPLRPTYATRS